MNKRALVAEFIGTFGLVAAICGAALFAAPAGGGLVSVAFAAGFSLLAMAYAVGHISGAHFNPAVTLGLVAGGRFEASDAVGYILAQVAGGASATFILAIILGGANGGSWNDFVAVSNTYGGPKQFSMLSTGLTEVVITALFVFVIMGVTSSHAPQGFAPIAIGLALALFHIIAIPISNASLNPARSTAAALFGGVGPLSQLWLFWVAPIAGGVIGGLVAKWLQEE